MGRFPRIIRVLSTSVQPLALPGGLANDDAHGDIECRKVSRRRSPVRHDFRSMADGTVFPFYATGQLAGGTSLTSIMPPERV
jgi:hypothetical protein